MLSIALFLLAPLGVIFLPPMWGPAVAFLCLLGIGLNEILRERKIDAALEDAEAARDALLREWLEQIDKR